MLSSVESSPVLAKYLTLVLCLLLVMALGVRPALRHVVAPGRNEASRRKTPQELPVQTSVQAPVGAPEPEPPDPERKRAQEIFEQVTSQVKREPAQSSRLLQSWIHSE